MLASKLLGYAHRIDHSPIFAHDRPVVSPTDYPGRAHGRVFYYTPSHVPTRLRNTARVESEAAQRPASSTRAVFSFTHSASKPLTHRTSDMAASILSIRPIQLSPTTTYQTQAVIDAGEHCSASLDRALSPRGR